MNQRTTSSRKQMENANAIATDSAIATAIDSAKTGTESASPTASSSAIDSDPDLGPETATLTERSEIEIESETESETETATEIERESESENENENETASLFVVAFSSSSSDDAIGPRLDSEAATSRETANGFGGCSETNCFRHCTETTRRRLLLRSPSIWRRPRRQQTEQRQSVYLVPTAMAEDEDEDAVHPELTTIHSLRSRPRPLWSPQSLRSLRPL